MLRNKIGDFLRGGKPFKRKDSVAASSLTSRTLSAKRSRSRNLSSLSTLLNSKSPRRPCKKSSSKGRNGSLKGSSIINLILDTYLKSSSFDEKNEQEAITLLYEAKNCGKEFPCLLSEGVYGAAYQVKNANHNIIVKLPKSAKMVKGYGKDTDGFDEWEMKFNQLAYEAIQRFTMYTFGENLIAHPLGFWRSPSLTARGFKQNNFVFVYNFESSISTYAELIRTTALSKPDFKSIVFQVLLMLDALQNKVQGFCHNDLHGYNMLIKKNDSHASFSHNLNGEEKTMSGKYVIKLLDFGMCSSNKHETKDAKRLWRQTRGSPIVDFLMFCNKTLMYASAYNAKTRTYQAWNEEFLAMLGRIFPPQVIKNGKDTGQWLDQKYLHLDSAEAFTWIKKEFPRDTHPLATKVLNDSFFR